MPRRSRSEYIDLMLVLLVLLALLIAAVIFVPKLHATASVSTVLSTVSRGLVPPPPPF